MLVAVMVAVVLAVIVTANAGLTAGCVNRAKVTRILTNRSAFSTRVSEIIPYLGAITAVLLINKGLQDAAAGFARTYGFDATALFYAIEGDFVAWFQSLFPEVANLYFGTIYVFGYAILLSFPLLGYLFAESAEPYKVTVTSYAVNYAVAIPLYAGVLAYGPRVYSAEVSHGLLELFPEITGLLALANSAENVFPSLHTSMALTVLLIAVQTHSEFPRWTPIAAFLSLNIVVSTMALGIHWLVDVVAGVLLAWISVTVANHYVSWRQQSTSTSPSAGRSPTRSDSEGD